MQDQSRTWRHKDHLLRQGPLGVELIDTGSPISMKAPEEAVRAVHPDLRHLVGMDELARGPLLIDWSHGLVRQTLTPSDLRQMETPHATTILRRLMGVPAIEIRTERPRSDRTEESTALIDTGAPISYVPSDTVAGLEPVGEAQDFMPLFGDFTTPLYDVTIEVLGATQTIRVGVLPPLLEAALGRLLSSPWILGADFLRGRRIVMDFRNGRLVELHRRPWLQRVFDERLEGTFCGKIHCTTCGGGEFWDVVQQAAADELGVALNNLKKPDLNDLLLDGLRQLESPEGVRDAEAAVVFLLYRTTGWQNDPAFKRSWAGSIVAQREQIDSKQRRAREAQEQAETEERARRHQQRKQAHQDRLVAQRKRSEEWHRNHPGAAKR